MSTSPIAMLISAARAAPSADNSQPLRYHWDGAVLAISYDEARVGGTTFPADSPATSLALGCALENIRQMAAALAQPIRIEWLLRGEALVNVTLEVAPTPTAEQLSQAQALPLFSRHTNRFAHEPVDWAGAVAEGVEVCAAGEADIRPFEGKAPIGALASLVERASRIRFQTQAVHELLGPSLRFTSAEVARGDGLDLQTMGLPPGGGLFMKLTRSWPRMRALNKLGAYRAMAAIDAQPVARSGLVLAVCGHNSRRGAVDAGSVLQRSWIQLNHVGLAVHPYYVIADQLSRLDAGEVPPELVPLAQEIRSETRQQLGLDSEKALYMLLRVGRPKGEVPRSRRLPKEQLFTSTDPSGRGQ